MRLRALLLSLAALPAFGAGHSLNLQASAPEVTVTPAAVQRGSIELPQLEFVVRVEPACMPPSSAEALSLSIADTHVESDMAAAQEVIEISVPEQQISPLLVGEFCRDAEAVTSTSLSTKRYTGTLTLNAALVCAIAGSQTVTYASTPLDVVLVCAMDESDEEQPSADVHQ